MASTSAAKNGPQLASCNLECISLEDIPSDVFELLSHSSVIDIDSSLLKTWHERIRHASVYHGEHVPVLLEAPCDRSRGCRAHTHLTIEDADLGPTILEDTPNAAAESTEHRITAYYCPICWKEPFTDNKAWKRHVKGHWLVYACADSSGVRVPCHNAFCRHEWDRKDRWLEHHKYKNGHGCEDPECTHVDQAAKVINEWRAIGCGFCQKVFEVDLGNNHSMPHAMHENYNTFLNHVSTHFKNESATREQWDLNAVLWNLLCEKTVPPQWMNACSIEFMSEDSNTWPVLFWDDEVAARFISRLHADRGDDILRELLQARNATTPMRPDPDVNTDASAMPLSKAVLPVGESFASTHPYVAFAVDPLLRGPSHDSELYMTPSVRTHIAYDASSSMAPVNATNLGTGLTHHATDVAWPATDLTGDFAGFVDSRFNPAGNLFETNRPFAPEAPHPANGSITFTPDDAIAMAPYDINIDAEPGWDSTMADVTDWNVEANASHALVLSSVHQNEADEHQPEKKRKRPLSVYLTDQIKRLSRSPTMISGLGKEPQPGKKHCH